MFSLLHRHCRPFHDVTMDCERPAVSSFLSLLPYVSYHLIVFYCGPGASLKCHCPRKWRSAMRMWAAREPLPVAASKQNTFRSALGLHGWCCVGPENSLALFSEPIKVTPYVRQPRQALLVVCGLCLFVCRKRSQKGKSEAR